MPIFKLSALSMTILLPVSDIRIFAPNTGETGKNDSFYPVRNNAPLLPPGQRPSGPAAAAGLDFRIILVGFNAPLGFESQRLEFLTGFTPRITR